MYLHTLPRRSMYFVGASVGHLDDALDRFLVLPARSAHVVVACFVDVLFDVVSRDDVFLNVAYRTFRCSFEG